MPEKSALLDHIMTAATRPAMYFGSTNIDDVRQHLEGWRAHRRVFRDDDTFADRFFTDFHRFVAERYGDDRSLGWNRLLRDNSETEKDAFRSFVELVRAFAAASD